MPQTVRIKSHFRYGYTIYELNTLILYGVPLHGLNGKYEFKCFMMLKKKFQISRAYNTKKLKMLEKSRHCNGLTYQYLRCMHGVELSHQKGHLKGHLRTAWWGREGRRKRIRENKIMDTSHLRDVF